MMHETEMCVRACVQNEHLSTSWLKRCFLCLYRSCKWVEVLCFSVCSVVSGSLSLSHSLPPSLCPSFPSAKPHGSVSIIHASLCSFVCSLELCGAFPLFFLHSTLWLVCEFKLSYFSFRCSSGCGVASWGSCSAVRRWLWPSSSCSPSLPTAVSANSGRSAWCSSETWVHVPIAPSVQDVDWKWTFNRSAGSCFKPRSIWFSLSYTLKTEFIKCWLLTRIRKHALLINKQEVCHLSNTESKHVSGKKKSEQRM